MTFRYFVAALLVLLGSAAPLALAEPVRTEAGLVDGVQEASVRVFKGIPFAAPPVGALRWQPPQAVAKWEGTRAADRFAPVCPQLGAYPPESPPEPMSEDCLHLNVWQPPAAAERRLPVMVWIYGGGLENGSASTPLYWGDKLASHGVIVVTVSYRLGALGFLALPALRQESPLHSSGNYGLLDQIAALRWVQRNIAAFGGDPQRVTVFGQSSGANSVSALVASPLARGLFVRAIAESGGLFEPVEIDPGSWPAGAEAQGEDFMRRAGADSLAGLRRMSAEQLLKIPFGQPRLVIDGYVLRKAPFDAYRDGEQSDVELLIGNNADEGALFLGSRSVTTGNLATILKEDFPAPLVSLVGPGRAATDAAARRSAVGFEGDLRFGWDMWTWARLAASRGRHKVFFYEFSRTPPFARDGRYFGLGATHGMEMPYVFDHLDQQGLAWSEADRKLAAVMSAYWTNFAASGDPNGAGLPHWPAYTAATSDVMKLGEEIAPARLGSESRLRSIDRVYTALRFGFRWRWSLAVAMGAALAGLIVLAVLGIRRGLRPRVRVVAAGH
jgi:para-nitrobenzyl esterase